LLSISFVQITYAQLNAGAGHIALANSDEANSSDIFSIFNNPSGTSSISVRTVGFFYSPFPYGIKELANGNFALTQPTTLGNFNIGFSTYGFELYKENKFVLGYSSKISENFLFGISSYFQTTSIKRYGSSGQFNFSLGGLFLLSPNLNLGFSLHNPIRYSDSHINQPLIYNLGVSYFPIDRTTLNFSISKEIEFPISIRFGVEYSIIENIFIRIGTHNEPNIYSGGFGINYSLFTINYAITSHQELGLTHQFDVIIDID
jgi:hypothetical protein